MTLKPKSLRSLSEAKTEMDPKRVKREYDVSDWPGSCHDGPFVRGAVLIDLLLRTALELIPESDRARYVVGSVQCSFKVPVMAGDRVTIRARTKEWVGTSVSVNLSMHLGDRLLLKGESLLFDRSVKA
jgi:hypothetical protein